MSINSVKRLNISARNDSSGQHTDEIGAERLLRVTAAASDLAANTPATAAGLCPSARQELLQIVC